MGERRGAGTAAVHGGVGFRAGTGALMPPVFPTSTFAHGIPRGFDYTRSGNPNFRMLESTVAELEGTSHATVFASGVSAITAIVSTLSAGDRVLAEENLYGCTYRLFDRVFSKFGVAVEYRDFSNPAAREDLEGFALCWLESPTNPCLKVLDLAAIAERTRAAGVPLVVDNTFASPLLQRPAELGADLVLESTTKYLGGHSDALGGAVATDDRAWDERLRFAQKALGLHPSPWDCWLIGRGIRTLHLRMRAHCENAERLAAHLAADDRIERVIHPFLPDHPGRAIARRQMSGGGGIVTAVLGGGADAALAFCRRLEVFVLAESLGGVESLVCHPASMTHASIPAEVRRRVGIADGLVRLSVGVEDFADLRADCDRALDGGATG